MSDIMNTKTKKQVEAFKAEATQTVTAFKRPEDMTHKELVEMIGHFLSSTTRQKPIIERYLKAQSADPEMNRDIIVNAFKLMQLGVGALGASGAVLKGRSISDLHKYMKAAESVR